MSFDGVNDNISLSISDSPFANDELTFSSRVQIADNNNSYKCFITLKDSIGSSYINLCKSRS